MIPAAIPEIPAEFRAVHSVLFPKTRLKGKTPSRSSLSKPAFISSPPDVC